MDTIVLAPGGYLLDPDLGSDYERPWRLAKGLADHGFRVVVVARDVRHVQELGSRVEIADPPGHLPHSPVGRLVDRIKLYLHARQIAYRELRSGRAFAVHHLGPCSINSPTLIGSLPVPLIYGPVPAYRPRELEDDEWLSWLRTPEASSVQAFASKAAVGFTTVLAKRMWKSTVERADAVTVEAKANAPLERPDAIVIPPGIDPTQFKPEPTSVVQGRVIGVGRLLKRKGYDILIRAMARVAANYPRAHVLLVGDGPEAQNLESLTHDLGLASNVQFIGNVRRSDLPQLLQSAEVFCHPAIWDNVPFAPLEAMATGLPTLASSVGGLPDTVGEAGIIHPVGDESTLAENLIDVLTNANLRRELGLFARSRVLSRFTWDTMCDSYVELYKRLADSKRANHLASSMS